MLKKLLFAAVAILAAVLLAACGDSSKSTDTATEPAEAAVAEAVQEGETTTEGSDMKITSVKTDTNKETRDEKENAAEEATTTTAADTKAPAANAADAIAPAANAADTKAPAANAADTKAPAANTAVPAAQTNDDAAVVKDEDTGEDEQEEEAEEADNGDETVGIVSVDGDVLSLRGGPSSDNELLDIIPDGTELVIEEEQDGWGYVNYDGTYGWVSMDYIVE